MSYHLGWGTGRPMPADQDALPQPCYDLGSDYCSSLLYSFSATICGTPVNVNYIYCLITLATLVAHPKLGLIWFMNQHWNLLYILEGSFYLLLYNITMIKYYSPCVIRQLLWLRISDTTYVAKYRFLHVMSPRTMRKLSNQWRSLKWSDVAIRDLHSTPNLFPWHQPVMFITKVEVFRHVMTIDTANFMTTRICCKIVKIM